MTPTEKWLQIHIVALVAVSSKLIGSGLNSASLTVIGISAAIGSYIFTERLRWIRLNRVFANFAAITVAIYSISRFFGDDAGSQSKLAAIASLLTFVQAILLFQEKNSRLYWNIWMLSLLQVVVASALTVQFGAGALFFIFIIISMSAMCLMTLSVDRSDAQERFERKRLNLSRKNPAQSDQRSALSVFAAMQSQPAVAVADSSAAAKQLGTVITMSSIAGVITILFAAVFFYSIPRHDDVYFGPDYQQTSATGFATKIDFRHSSVIHSSDRRIMRMAFLDLDGKPLSRLAVDPYFRGIIMPHFGPDRSGRWEFSPVNVPTRLTEYPIGNADLGLIGEMQQISFALQDTRMDPSKQAILFTVAPTFQAPVADQNRDTQELSNFPDIARPLYERRLSVDHMSESIVRCDSPDVNLRPFDFQILTPLYYGDRQLPSVPAVSNHHKRCSGSLPPITQFPSIYKAASEVRQSAPNADTRQLANLMANYFKRFEQFSYTLDYTDVKIDESLHPIEDFMRNRRTGHCEYYASSLALMLRVAGIPSRVVSGYRGVDFNDRTREYTVMDRDAHTWVEAYISPRNCTQSMFATGQASRTYGAWLRLDPTPDSDQSTDSVGYKKNLFDHFSDLFGFVQKFWEESVVGIDADQQAKSVVNPRQSSLLSSFVENSNIREETDAFASDLRAGKFRKAHWVVLGILTSFIVGTIALVVFRRSGLPTATPVRRGLIGRVLGSLSPRLERLIFGEIPPARQNVAFYRKFEKLMSNHGIYPLAAQTSLEFANAAVTELNHRASKIGQDSLTNDQQNSPGAAIQELTTMIVKEYYRVRFGQHDLENERQIRINAALEDLSSRLSQFK